MSRAEKRWDVARLPRPRHRQAGLQRAQRLAFLLEERIEQARRIGQRLEYVVVHASVTGDHMVIFQGLRCAVLIAAPRIN
ncbi:hypothetical protein [Trinickia terrae]|uniref:hypothetical protein n=1 Tax=Trinickia terrae TaxID=2571161 RepID=UPI00146AD4A5|nr:hypothetical protein [Trinickia terrae]